LWDENFGLDFEYPYNPNDGRENLDAGENVRRVLRGGSFHSYRERSRCAYRYVGYAPDNNWDSGGFRVMVSSISPLAYQKAAHSARQGSPDPGLAAESARHKTLTATVRSARLTAGPGADQTTSH